MCYVTQNSSPLLTSGLIIYYLLLLFGLFNHRYIIQLAYQQTTGEKTVSWLKDKGQALGLNEQIIILSMYSVCAKNMNVIQHNNKTRTLPKTAIPVMISCDHLPKKLKSTDRLSAFVKLLKVCNKVQGTLRYSQYLSFVHTHCVHNDTNCGMILTEQDEPVLSVCCPLDIFIKRVF